MSKKINNVSMGRNSTRLGLKYRQKRIYVTTTTTTKEVSTKNMWYISKTKPQGFCLFLELDHKVWDHEVLKTRGNLMPSAWWPCGLFQTIYWWELDHKVLDHEVLKRSQNEVSRRFHHTHVKGCGKKGLNFLRFHSANFRKFQGYFSVSNCAGLFLLL